MHWSSRVSRSEKQNAIAGDLHRSKQISNNFEKVVQLIKYKVINAAYPLKFINIIINQFNNPKMASLILFYPIFLKI